jgi:gliding motility-associated-like protein
VVLQTTITPHYRGPITYSVFSNLVTPNGDGYNDTWTLGDNGSTQYAYNAHAAVLEVYNRWGALVWKQVREAGPNGFAQGEIFWNPNDPDVVDGSYYIYLTLSNCDETKTLKGWVSVLFGQGNRMAATTFGDSTDYHNTLDLKEDMIVSPNPSSGNFEIRLMDEPDEGTIYIYNHVGGKVKEIKIEDGVNIYSIDLNSEKEGIYLIVIDSGKEFKTRKIILKK